MTALLAVSSGGVYVDLPTPAKDGYTTTPNELSNAGRNTSGVLYKDRIRVSQSIEVTWNGLTPEEKNELLSLTSTNSFNVRYFDTQDSTIKYGLFYRGSDLVITPLVRYDGTDFVAYNVSMSLVEF